MVVVKHKEIFQPVMDPSEECSRLTEGRVGEVTGKVCFWSGDPDSDLTMGTV